VLLYLFRRADKPDKPGAGKPGAYKPGADKPGAGKPGAYKPGAGKPGAGKPGAGAIPCGCVFDIDDTLTCGNPANVVRMCKENGCVLGLNTARNMPYALDVPLKEQGFPPNVLNSGDFVYNPAPTFENVVPTKVKGLQDFQHKWKIDSPSRILFFDDSLMNIEGANAAGFKGVWCPKTPQQCGVGLEQEKITERFFRASVIVRE